MRIQKQLIPNATCRECRLCCRFSALESPLCPHLLEEEKATAPFSSYDSLVLQDTCQCRLLDAHTNLCTHYAKRPLECQLYPFLIHRQGNALYLSVHLSCPYMQDNLTAPQTIRYRELLMKWLETPKIRDMLRKNCGAFASYPKEEIIVLCGI
jgi:Fe-S-cluster containining protein